MFRDKSTSYDRLSDAISDLGSRIGEMEGRISERLSPRPSRAERLRRTVARGLPFYHEPTGIGRYLPGFVSELSLPSDARRQLRSLKGSAEDGLDGARGYLEEARDYISHLSVPSKTQFRRRAKHIRHQSNGLSTETTVLLALGGTAAAAGLAYYVTKKVQEHAEEPDYEVVRADGDIEIRDYDGMIVAETVKTGYHEKARRTGFQTLADYIFARNRSGKKIKMTTPVLQQLSEGEGRTKGWAVRFVMPKKFTRASLPEPGTSEVAIREIGPRRIVAIKFNGNFNATLASKYLMSLYNYLADNNLKQKGDPEYAFYNPPWVPGFMKRNEILIEIER